MLGSGKEWGIAYLWPLKEKFFYFSPPFQWELSSWQNLVVTLVLIIMIILCSLKYKRTIVEVVSSKVDAQVVNVFQRWFKGAMK
ncbi:hypothetical protein N9N67_10490 [Bacteriovoracaceae bacterium]|nr:hypothetical protein [Bacteriovoracaceae bacterium]